MQHFILYKRAVKKCIGMNVKIINVLKRSAELFLLTRSLNKHIVKIDTRQYESSKQPLITQTSPKNHESVTENGIGTNEKL